MTLAHDRLAVAAIGYVESTLQEPEDAPHRILLHGMEAIDGTPILDIKATLSHGLA
jgi:tRNA (Thr-GGU) A37 N-methylase